MTIRSSRASKKAKCRVLNFFLCLPVLLSTGKGEVDAYNFWGKFYNAFTYLMSNNACDMLALYHSDVYNFIFMEYLPYLPPRRALPFR